MKKRLVEIAMILSLAALVWGCAREGMPRRAVSGGAEAGIEISLLTKSAGEGTSVQADSFWVELYNARAVRIYSKQYKDAKSENIKVNAGQFRLIAFCGDTLGAGFDKAYYLADTTFTVHGFLENGGEPDRISATARRGNVELEVNFGDNLRTYYSNYYAIVRHDEIARKSVKFLKDETRHAFIPGGKAYLEVFAQLAGRGMQDGGVKDSLVYYRTETKTYVPGDMVTFNIDCAERQGTLDLQISAEGRTPEVSQLVSIPADTPPSIFYHGVQGDSFSKRFSIGTGAAPEDLSLNFASASGIREAVLQINNTYLTSAAGLPASVDLTNISAADESTLKAAGISWIADEGNTYGYVNVGGTMPALSLHSEYSAASPSVATFILSVKDAYDNISAASLDLLGKPIEARVEAADCDIWGWKLANPSAVIAEVEEIPDGASFTLQYSNDGQTWKQAAQRSISGNRVYFNDATGLLPGNTCRFRVMAGSNPDNVSSESTFSTEVAEQLPNNGFEEFSEQATEVPTLKIVVVITKFTITWWQLYAAGGTRFWAVNSPVSIRTGATAAYQDYKSYPTVAVFTDGAYSGNSVQVATIAENNAASEILYGTYHPGELFIGRANDEIYDSWAKTSEGGTLGSRPRALRFQHKFNCNGSKPYYVHIEILDADGNKIGEATKNDQTSSVNSWTAVTIPINYTVTDRKAAGIKLSFMSSRDGSDDNHRSVTVNTLSGEHKIHAGNILSLDNIELVYSE